MPIDPLMLSYAAPLAASAPSTWTLLLMAFLLFALVILVVFTFIVGSRVLRLSSRDAAHVTAIGKLAGELEGQAMLIRQMAIDLEELRKPGLDRETAAQPEMPLWAASLPVNLNRRGQILRLARKGKSVAEIAQDLNVAQGEVELLLKLQDLGQKSLSQETNDVLS